MHLLILQALVTLCTRVFNLEAEEVSRNYLLIQDNTNLLMFYKAKVAVCSEIRTKHINAMWAPRRLF
jgi:hypothetical protein